MKSFLYWPGGKRHLADRIVSLMPPHQVYVEPFLGAGWVFWRKPPSNLEVLNDIDGLLVNLWKVIQDKELFTQLRDKLETALVSRQLFEEFCGSNWVVLDEVEMAFRYLYMNKLGFGGIVQKWPAFSTRKSKKPAKLTISEGQFREWWKRLQRVVIENRDYMEVMATYDSEDTFFYVDPPYYDAIFRGYIYIFSKEKHRELRDFLLDKVSGKFILSLNEHDEVRELYKEFQIIEVPTTWTINKNESRKVNELLIANFDIVGMDMPLFKEDTGGGA